MNSYKIQLRKEFVEIVRKEFESESPYWDVDPECEFFEFSTKANIKNSYALNQIDEYAKEMAGIIMGIMSVQSTEKKTEVVGCMLSAMIYKAVLAAEDANSELECEP